MSQFSSLPMLFSRARYPYLVGISFAGKETLRCLALAFKRLPTSQHLLSVDDEKDLTFIGLVGILFAFCPQLFELCFSVMYYKLMFNFNLDTDRVNQTC